MFDAFLFDFDGVIADTLELYRTSIRSAAKSWGIHLDAHDLSRFDGQSAFSVASELVVCHKLKITEETFLAKQLQVYSSLLSCAECNPLPGVDEIMSYCSQHALLRALVSNANLKRELILAIDVIQSKLIHHLEFDVVISGDCTSRRKPHPDPYQKAMELLDVQGPCCVAFEDSIAGVQSARRAGCFVVGIHGSGSRNSLLEGGADASFSSLLEAVQIQPWKL